MTSEKYTYLKQKLNFELEFVSKIGAHVFVYPYIGRSKVALFFYHFTYCLVLFTSAQLFVSLICVRNDWFEIINIAPNLGACLMILIKYGQIHKSKEVYKDIFSHYTHTFWDVVFDTNGHLNILDRYIKSTKIITRFAYYYTIILIVIVNIFPRIIMVYENNILGKEVQYLYPFEGWYPFDKVNWYYTVYAWESFMTTVVIYIYVCCNIIHVSYTRYICMELKILGYSMQSLIRSEGVWIVNGTPQYVDHKYVQEKFKHIIKSHQALAKTTCALDKVLGDGMLVTYIFGSAFICLTIFTATVVDNTYKALRYFSFFCSLLLEVFFQCIIGQLLIDHSANLEKAVYSVDWPQADIKTRKMLLILLMRAQKPFTYSANGYTIMNLDTFSGICKLSYQFFNLLHTAYS